MDGFDTRSVAVKVAGGGVGVRVGVMVGVGVWVGMTVAVGVGVGQGALHSWRQKSAARLTSMRSTTPSPLMSTVAGKPLRSHQAATS